MQQITANVSNDLMSKIHQTASQLNCSYDALINEALSSWLSIEELKDKLTQEALDDVEQGRVISHEEMFAWLNGLPE